MLREVLVRKAGTVDTGGSCCIKTDKHVMGESYINTVVQITALANAPDIPTLLLSLSSLERSI